MSSLTRRIQIRIMKKRGVEKVPCPYGRMQDSGTIDGNGTPVMVPVYVYPQFAPKADESSQG